MISKYSYDFLVDTNEMFNIVIERPAEKSYSRRSCGFAIYLSQVWANHRICNQLLLNILRVISQKYGHKL